MSTRSIVRLLTAVCCAAAVTISVHAQSHMFSFNADQKFSAANKQLAAGRYEAEYDGVGGFLLTNGKDHVRVPVITRLARYTRDNGEIRLVFDELDTGERILSEIWVPGEDGYLVCTLEKQHHHVTTKAQMKAATQAGAKK